MVVYGAGRMDVNEEGLLLILRRGVTTFDNLWSNPGGHVEPGESAEDAVVREFREELGVVVEVDGYISDYFDVKGEETIGQYTGFHVRIVEGVPRVMEPDKIAKVRRFPLDRLPENLAPYTRKYFVDAGYQAEIDDLLAGC